MTTRRETAQRQSIEIQEAVIAKIHALSKIGYPWALLGGETSDDGGILRVTIVLATRYAGDGEYRTMPREPGAMSGGPNDD